MKKSAAFWLAFGLGVAGTAWLAVAVNLLSAALAASTIVIYVLLYTPMKRRTAWWVRSIA